MARRTFLSQLVGLSFLALGSKVQASKKPLRIMMKSAWGPDDPTRAAFPLCARTSARRSWPRSTNLPSRWGHLLAPKVHGERDPPGGLAAVKRNARKGCRQTHTDLCLRNLLPGPWGHGNRLESMGSKIRKSRDLCLTRGMVRPNYRGVKSP
jgi:hypothetical protein